MSQQLDRRQTLKLLAGAGAAAALPGLAACGGPSSGDGSTGAARGTVKVGLLIPQSGTLKVVGDDLTQGFRLYLQTHGNRLGGHDVDLRFADEGESVDSGKAAATRLLKQDGVAAVTGVASSTVLDAIKDEIETAQIPLIGSNASHTTLQGVKYIWRTSYVNDEPGRALGRYLAEKVPGPLYVLAADYQAGKDEVAGMLETFTPAGGRLAAPPEFTPFTPTPVKDFTPYLNKIRNFDARSAYCFYVGASAVDFVKQYRQAGLTLPLFAPGFLTEGTVLTQQGEAANGIFTSLNYAADLDNPANRSFAAEYQKTYKQVATTYAMASYDAAAVLDKAIQLADGDLSGPALNAAIGRVGQLDSPRGSWQFNQTRTPTQKWYLRQVRMDGTVLSNVLVSELTTLG